MIIECPKCSARFKVADDKIKPGGIKVRCSRCREIFPIKPGIGAGPSRPQQPPTRQSTDPFALDDPFDQTRGPLAGDHHAPPSDDPFGAPMDARTPPPARDPFEDDEPDNYTSDNPFDREDPFAMTGFGPADSAPPPPRRPAAPATVEDSGGFGLQGDPFDREDPFAMTGFAPPEESVPPPRPEPGGGGLDFDPHDASFEIDRFGVDDIGSIPGLKDAAPIPGLETNQASARGPVEFEFDPGDDDDDFNLDVGLGDASAPPARATPEPPAPEPRPSASQRQARGKASWNRAPARPAPEPAPAAPEDEDDPFGPPGAGVGYDLGDPDPDNLDLPGGGDYFDPEGRGARPEPRAKASAPEPEPPPRRSRAARPQRPSLEPGATKIDQTAEVEARREAPEVIERTVVVPSSVIPPSAPVARETGAAQTIANLFLIVILVGVGFLGYVAWANDGLLDFKALGDQVAASFGKGTYTARGAAKAPEPDEPGEQPQPVRDPDKPLEIDALEQTYFPNSDGAQLFIIEGQVINQGQEPVRQISVEGTVFDAARAPIGTMVAPAGRTLSEEELLDVTAPEGLARTYEAITAEARPLVLSPGQAMKFTLVFVGLPGAVTDARTFAVEVKAFKVGAEEPPPEPEPSPRGRPGKRGKPGKPGKPGKGR